VRISALPLLLVACSTQPAPAPASAPAPSPIAKPTTSPPTSARQLVERLLKMADAKTIDFSPLVPDHKRTSDPPRLTGKSGDGAPIEFALAHTSVYARVSGNIAQVEVQQLYQNPTSNRLEAIYAFPLPENAAVTDMLFRIKNRVVRSEVRRRAEAKAEYERAKQEGKTAALTEQERPNLFTQSVANIPPGESVEVILRYTNEIAFDDGRYTFHFPTTIGPRYIPASGVADANRVTPPVIAPGMRSAHDIEIAVELMPGAAFADTASRSHRIVTATDGDKRLVTLAPEDTIPNKDFILAWRPASQEPDARLLTQADADGRYMMLFVQPPSTVTHNQVRPKQMVFLIDKSGSMMGQPIEAAKRVIMMALRNMGRDDTFQLVAFDSATVTMSDDALPNTPANLRQAESWLSSLSGAGGTEMLSGIRTALDLPTDPKRLRMVVFCTDGFIGNEQQIIEHIEKERNGARVFGFGIGTSVNRYLIEGVARAGRGAAEYVRLQDPVDDTVARLYKRLDRPVLTDLEVSFDGIVASDLLPQRLPDLFAGQPLVIVGKSQGAPSAKGGVTLKGRLGDQPWTRHIPLAIAGDQRGSVLGTLWARRRIDDLSSRQQWGEPSKDVQEEIIALALRRKLITQYTSFVAVEKQVSVDTRIPLDTLLVGNELPEGVAFQGIFGEGSAQVTPARVKPGDPELRVIASASARSVFVTLPFESAPREAVKDRQSGEWVARFLVPSGWPDGSYDAKVAITHEDGRREESTVSLRVDTTPASVAVLSSPGSVRPGQVMRIEMKPCLPLAEIGAHMLKPNPGGVAYSLKGAMDVKEVLVRAPWGEVVRARMEGALGQYVAELHVPDGQALGPASLEIVAGDGAGNVSRRTLDITVGGAAKPPYLMGAFALLALALITRRLRKNQNGENK
jgi:Ca-activated chloride channel homolog